jgi:hypothetical protein
MTWWWLLCQTWIWPIDTTAGLTSSFGEYRGNRFHMGLDFSTNGVEGAPIRAAASGRVFRVRAQAHGYGLCVELRHADGWSSLYAHLAAFAPALAEAIAQKGVDPAALFGEMALDLEVEAGSLIAYSGESGAGMPHLHFELRDAGGAAVNPLSLDFPALKNPMELAPLRIRLVPLSPHSLVKGSPGPLWLGQKEDRIPFHGPVGIEVEAALVNGRGSVMGVEEIHLNMAQGTAQWVPTRLPYGQGKAGKVFNLARSSLAPSRYLYRFDAWAGGSALADHRVLGANLATGSCEIVVKGGGREQRRTLYFEELDPSDPKAVSPPAPFPSTELALAPWLSQLHFTDAADAPGKLLVHGGVADFANSGASLTVPAKGPLVLRDDQGEPFALPCALLAGGGTRQLGPFSLSAESPLGMRLDEPGGKTLDQPLAMVLIQAPTAMRQKGLHLSSEVLLFGWEGFLSDRIAMKVVEEGHQGVYAWSHNKKKWQFWGLTSETIALDYLTPMVLAEDLENPVVGKARLHDFFSGRQRLIPLKDEDSGINPASIRISSAGKRVPHLWDPDRAAARIDPAIAFPLQVVVADRAGRRVEVLLPNQ